MTRATTERGGDSERVVVVARPDDAAELRALVEQEGFTVAWCGGGDDDTLHRIVEQPPSAVVLSAALDAGDARSLAAAVRRAAPATGLVLVGEDDGPVRNALDALDFAVDRFVGRPLSAKALGFAIRSAARAAGPGAADAAPRSPATSDSELGALPAREPTMILPDAGGDVPAAPVVEPVPEYVPPASSDLARELREKMSEMAQRLFPGRAAPAAVGPEVDPHGEIDLGAIGTLSDAADADPFADIAEADTFSDDARTPPPHWADEPSGEGSNPALFGEIPVDNRDAGGTGASDAAARRSPAPIHGVLAADGDDVASVFARLYRDAATGVLTFRRGDAAKVVWFDRGKPVFATSNLPHDRMGDLLYREGKITRAQYARSRELAAESGRRMGEILVDMGFLKRRELLPAVRRHLEDIVYSLFAWDAGDYAFEPGDAALDEKIRLSRHPAALIVEGVRRKYGLDQLEARLGAATSVVVARADADAAATLKEIELTPAERRAVALLDGTRTLEQVIAQSGLDALGVYAIAFGLVVLGLAELADTGDAGGSYSDVRDAPALVGATDLAIDRERVLAKFAQVEDGDYFAVLGVRRDATAFEIRRAYEAAKRDYAPETFPQQLRAELAEELAAIGALLDEAYAVLRDDALRASYRAHLID